VTLKNVGGGSILVVEDEYDIRNALEARLAHSGFRVVAVEDAEDARLHVSKTPPDLCLLDINLPGEDGLSLCRWLRNKAGFHGPVIFLTARDSVADKVLGLETGGDDYICKPFDFNELLARVRAQMRPRAAASSPVVETSTIVLDTGQREAKAGGKTFKLTFTEFELLSLLVRAAPRPISKKELLSRVWGYVESSSPDTRTVEMHVSRLRKKLGRTGKQICSAPGVGYFFRP
jgi:DNA-binding response OmpR family regulator